MKTLIVYGELVKHEIPESLMKNDLLGTADKIAQYKYRQFADSHPELEKIVVLLNCREYTYQTLDLETMEEYL